MVLTIILSMALSYAVWKWWTYFCMTVYLTDHITKHGVNFPTELEFRNYAHARAAELPSNFLKS